jgi:hypothetical protein
MNRRFTVKRLNATIGKIGSAKARSSIPCCQAGLGNRASTMYWEAASMPGFRSVVCDDMISYLSGFRQLTGSNTLELKPNRINSAAELHFERFIYRDGCRVKDDLGEKCE